MKLFPGLAITTAIVFTTGVQADPANYQNTTAKIETRIGTLEYKGGYPTEETAQAAYDQLDVQRATQAYLEFMPMASVNSIFEAHIRDYGRSTASDVSVYVEQGIGWMPGHFFTTRPSWSRRQ